MSEPLTHLRAAVARAARDVRAHPSDPAALRALEAARERYVAEKLADYLDRNAASPDARRRIVMALA